MNLGSELVFKTTITHPGRSSQINDTYKIPAGSYVLINSTSGLNVTLQLIGGDKSKSCFLGGFFAGISMTVIVLKFPDLPGEVLSAIGPGHFKPA